MKAFMDADFLLSTDTAKTLYHNHAAKVPVVDYHCHINPAEIAQNRSFENITQAWLGGDHYKWRIMRSNGVEEKYITGDATDYEKFLAFATALPKAIGNPMYHWCHLELQRYFGCTTPLNEKTAPAIWEQCNAVLTSGDMKVRDIIRKSNVTTVVTTDDPIDSLEYHKAIQEDSSFSVQVLPGWRPDKAIYIEREEFTSYIEKLAEVSGMKIQTVADLQQALSKRMDHFAEHGCRASDHGVNAVVYAPASARELDEILAKRLAGKELTATEMAAFQYNLMVFLGKEYARRGWVMEIHFGAMRNVNTKGFKALGPDTGFDCISNADCMADLNRLLDELNQQDLLPKTILFSLNPTDNAAITSAIGCFQGTEAEGKIQHGSAWWFNDTKHGMEQQMENLASMSLLGNFIGMLTDSRSFLSYTRHEYFRRILCNLLGKWVENGEYPADMQALGSMVENISYNNTMAYFGF